MKSRSLAGVRIDDECSNQVQFADRPGERGAQRLLDFGVGSSSGSGTNETVSQPKPGDPRLVRLVAGMFSLVFRPQASPPSTSNPSDPQPVDPQALNTPPIISGTAPTQAMVGAHYEFAPSAADSDGDTLRFSATGLPVVGRHECRIGRDIGHTARRRCGTNRGHRRDSDRRQGYGRAPAVSDRGECTTATAGTFSTPPPAPASNTPPRISGAPATTVQAQSGYSFRPSASDPEGQGLTFSIANKPSWAAFSTATGTLSGTPARDQDGTYGNITISVSDGSLTASLPSFSIVVSPAPNGAPTIGGTPTASLVADTAYSFRPSASDPDGDALSFSISGKPSWASFDASTGALSGTPTDAQAGTYSNIVIRVSDGNATTSLGTFAIVVNRKTMGSATLSWAAPTQNVDGSAITNLSGYRIYYGASAGSLGTMVQVSNPGISTYVVDNLSSGTWYFAVTAYNSAGAESDRSAVGSKAIP